MASEFEAKVLRTLDLLDRSREYGIDRNRDVDTRLERLNERLTECGQYYDKRQRITEDRFVSLQQQFTILQAEFDALKAGINVRR